MTHLLVLGGGWIGSAVVRAATGRVPVSSFDPVGPTEAVAPSVAEVVEHRRADVVVNACGALRGPRPDLEAANVEFVRDVCHQLRDSGVRLVHVGSAAEYGDPGSSLPVTETTPLRPVGDYAATKARGSSIVIGSRAEGLRTCVARPFNLVDLPLPPISPLRQWLDDVVGLGPGGGEVEVWWPDTLRDFSFRDDVAAAIVDLALVEDPPAVVNVCTGVGLRFGDIVEHLGEALGRPVRVRSLERPGIPAVVGDPSLLAATIGWAPSMTLVDLVGRITPPQAPATGDGNLR